ncbi:MAG: hypothetical protein K0R18_135 [Bacillales bacterium]|jgi:hypothetical protein|nr:hypothetical protein [Bacillales bacterium]
MGTILTPINQKAPSSMSVREREWIQQLRVMLKDLPDQVNRTLGTLVEQDRGERWTDMQLLIYLNQAVADLNVEPPHTSFTLDVIPEIFKACIINGATIFALIAEGILQVGESFSYSDNGISLSINLAQGYQSLAQMLLTGYTQLKKDIKRAMRPHAAGIKQSPAPVKVRSYAPRQWTYR